MEEKTKNEMGIAHLTNFAIKGDRYLDPTE